MRIISACLAIAFVTLLVLPETALADEPNGSNETKINFKIQEVGFSSGNILLGNKENGLLAYDPNNFKNTVAMAQIDPERESALERFNSEEKKQKLPKGKFVINASAYTAAADECGKSDGITASGVKVRENETLACPAQFPFGTKIQIEGMGIYVCEDRGGAIKANHVDIYMKTKTQAFGFGRQNLVAEIVS
ncbi:MAG: 3D domain-containing protein [Parcubacteria group bacterium]